MKNIIGIDLGTTMSVLAKLNDLGKPESVAIPSENGRLLASAVMFEDNSVTIGRAAKNHEKSVREFKRKMHVEEYRYTAPNNEQYTATQLSSLVLKKLIQKSSQQIGSTITDVVISVPAYFKERERNATIQAGELAGVNVLAIINEPTAAALYYASNRNIHGRGLVYDLGGGTFDVTVVDTQGKDVNVVSSAGDHHLGGVDFNVALLELMEEKYYKATDMKLYETDEDKYGFLLDAESIKHDLSSRAMVASRLAGEGGKVNIEITQEEFEEKISTYISRTELLLEQVLMEAKSEPEDIDYILLVGGSTRIPAIRKSIKKLLGKEPLDEVNVDEAVAFGAAIKAGIVMTKNNPEDVSDSTVDEMNKFNLIDVTNHSYGTLSVSYDSNTEKDITKNSIIIEKNTPLPCSKTEKFYTIVEGQLLIDISITQGEESDPEFVEIIKKESMSLPPKRPSQQPIEITYAYDENQIMQCIFRDINSGIEKNITLKMDKTDECDPLADFLVD